LALKILQFYASPGQIFFGDQATVCYGVEGAVTVRIEPEVEQIKPSLSRCIVVAPKKDTAYRLIAQGPGAEETSKTLRIEVKPIRRPAPAIAAFTASEARLKPGGSTKLCFRVENAESLRVDPPVQYLGASVSGSLV